MKSILGVIIIILSVFLGLYVGLYLCLYGGIVDVIQGAVATPVQVGKIAFGIVKVFCTGLAGWLTFLFGYFIGGVLIATDR